MRLPISTICKNKNYDLIFVIVSQLTKIVSYKSLKITIIVYGLAKMIFCIKIQY